MAFKPNVKKHLFETAHSGFYGGEQSGTVVNLLPKTWTKYTVTDGEWKEEYTIEPLVKRDIYLANMIDAIEYDKRHHYEASSHFIIDHEKKEMSVNPFDTLYNFYDGIIYDEDRNYIYTQTPPKYGGVINKLYNNGQGLDYLIKKNENPYYTATSADYNSIVDPDVKVNDVSGYDNIKTQYDTYFNDAGIILVDSGYKEFLDKSTSSYKAVSHLDCWSASVNKRYIGPDWNYDKNETSSWDTSSYYSSYFNPFDRTITQFDDPIQAGDNFISADIDMVPSGVLFIW